VVKISGGTDPDSGIVTDLIVLGGQRSLDFGTVNPLFGQPRTGERIPMRDGSGYYLVATLEVTVDEAGRVVSVAPVSPGSVLDGPSGARSIVRPPPVSDLESTRLPRRASRRPGRKTRVVPGTGLRVDAAYSTPLVSGDLAVRVVGAEVLDAVVRVARGTAVDWGAGSEVGLPLSATDTVVETGLAPGTRVVHQIAWCVPSTTHGQQGFTVTYSYFPRTIR